MTDDSDLFRTREALEADGWQLHGNVFTRAGKRMLPLYEAKMVHLFDHRWNSYYGTRQRGSPPSHSRREAGSFSAGCNPGTGSPRTG